MAIFENLYFTR